MSVENVFQRILPHIFHFASMFASMRNFSDRIAEARFIVLLEGQKREALSVPLISSHETNRLASGNREDNNKDELKRYLGTVRVNFYGATPFCFMIDGAACERVQSVCGTY